MRGGTGRRILLWTVMGIVMGTVMGIVMRTVMERSVL